MAADIINNLNDDELGSVTGGAGDAGRKQYPDWLKTIDKMVGSYIYGIYDKDGGHGVYLDMVKRFGPAGLNTLLVPEEFRY